MLDVLYEDNHLLIVNKPALLPTMGVSEDRPSLLTVAKEYIGKKYNKPGKVYLGIVSRLDAPVTGVVLLARTSKAASRLTEQFREHEVEKTYWAVVEGEVDPTETQLEHFLRKDERNRRMHVCNESAPGAQRALLSYRSVDRREGTLRRSGQKSNLSLVEVQLLTGRKHQIRVQLAAAGHPIVGDLKYGGREQFPRGIALHSRRLVVEHPTLKEPIRVEAPLPPSWSGFIAAI